MSRLTKAYSDGTHGASDNLPCGENSYDYKNFLIEKLGTYEDLEEQGMLIKLPCKIGDTVWDNDFGYPCSYTITAFSFGECESYVEHLDAKEIVFYFSNSFGDITGSFLVSAIGESVFFSREEAEAKLKELRDGENDNS